MRQALALFAIFTLTLALHANTRALGLEFTPILNDTAYEVSRGEAIDTDIVIPPMYNFLPVTRIAEAGFSSNASLTSIVIPNTITTIANFAFLGCSNLESITIPTSVTSIGEYAFANCQSLTSLSIPSSVVEIGSHAFTGQRNLTSISVAVANPIYRSEENCLIQGQTVILGCLTSVIPPSVTTIGNHAFYASLSLTNIAIPSNITSIGDQAFGWCTSLTSIDIPSNVITIGQYAFRNCSLLTSITIAEGVTTIGQYAFNYCTSLIEISLPNSLTSIGQFAFTGCESLTSLALPPSITSIENHLFEGCIRLRNITIPASVSIIKEGAFTRCASLTSITIPTSVTQIGSYAFSDCASLASITIPSSVTQIGNYAFASCHGLVIFTDLPSKPTGWASSWNPHNRPVVWGGGSGSLLFEPINNGTEYQVSRGTTPDTVISIPATYNGLPVTKIKEQAFERFGGLVSIDIPSSITYIGEDAFAYCRNLTNITIPNGVTNIFHYTFMMCISLESVNIPASVTSIGIGAFEICESLTNIYIPASVVGIRENAFAACFNLVIYTAHQSKPYNWLADWNPDHRPVIWGGVSDGLSFRLIDGGTAYEVSQGVLNEADVVIPAVYNNLPVTSIAEYGFANYTNLTSVIIPNSIIDIGEYAFSRCVNLTSIAIPEGLTQLSEGAFFHCEGLTSITFTRNIRYVAGYAFGHCYNLTEINVPNSNIVIFPLAFSYCHSLASINVEAGHPLYTSEGNCLILDGTELVLGCYTSEIPPSVTTIGGGAFVGCVGLTNLIIPRNVTTIRQLAFADCSNLTTIFIPNSVTVIFSMAFRYSYKLQIYTEFVQQPPGWQTAWNESDRPVIWGATTQPVAPAFLVAQYDENAVHLVWKPVTLAYKPYFLSYAVYRDGVLLADTAVTNPVYSDYYPPEGNHTYYVTAVFTNGESEPSNTVSVVSEGDVVAVNAVTRLMGNYPNPFNPTTTIAYEVAREGRVVIEVFNSKGQKVGTLVNGVHNAGVHRVVWDGAGVGSGVYFCKMVCGGYVGVRKMVVVK